jgi:hypothetical protein
MAVPSFRARSLTRTGAARQTRSRRPRRHGRADGCGFRHDPPPAALTLNQQNSIVIFLPDGRIQLQGATQDVIAGQVISSMIPRNLFLAEIGIPGTIELQRGLRKLDSFAHASRKL